MLLNYFITVCVFTDHNERKTFKKKCTRTLELHQGMVLKIILSVKNKPWISLMVNLVVYKIITLSSDLKNPPSIQSSLIRLNCYCC